LRWVRLARCASFAATMLALRAAAQAPEANASLFRPATGGDGTLGVEGAAPLSEGVAPIELQILLDAAHDPVRLLPARVSRRMGPWELLGNGFLRFRPPRDLGEARIGNEIGLRTAARYDASDAVKPFAELEGSTSLRALSWATAPIEVRAGARFCLFEWLAADAAVGTRLDDAV